MLKYILILCGFLLIVSVNAQLNLNDTAIGISYSFADDDSWQKTDKYYVDTGLLHFQRYDPIKKINDANSSLGNIGLAYRSMIFLPVEDLGFDYGNHSFDKYLFNKKNIKFYQLRRPLTEVSYIKGSEKEQLFSVMHSQKVSTTTTLGLDFKIINSTGPYENHKSNNARVAVNAECFSKSHKYRLKTAFYNNKIVVEENGGIKNDSIFENNLEIDRTLFDLRLNRANNERKENAIFLKHSFNFQKIDKHQEKADTLYYDTIPQIQRNVHWNLGKISHFFSYKSTNQIFVDDANTFDEYYNELPVFVDSTKTNHQVKMKQLNNRFSINNVVYDKKQFFTYDISLKHEYIQLQNDTSARKKLIQNMIPSVSVAIQLLKNLRIYSEISIVLSNEFQNNYMGKAGVFKSFLLDDKRVNTSLKLLFFQKNSSYFYQDILSNHFNWNQKLENEKCFKTKFQMSIKNLNLNIQFYNYNNFTFLDQNIQPKQIDNLAVFKASIRKTFHLKNFVIDNFVMYQNANRPEIRLPDIIYNLSFYYNQSLFKNALQTTLGFDVNYNSSYYSLQYMPEIQKFYLQNEKKTGNYFYADVFLSLNVNRARFLIKYDHINHFLQNYSYYTVPHYPMQDGGLKLGISWRFHN